MKILAAFDGSEPSRHALAFLRRLPLPSEREVVLLWVAERPDAFLPRSLVGVETAHEILEEAHQSHRRTIAAALAAEAKAFERDGWQVDQQVIDGNPADRITALGTEQQAQWITVGAQGANGAHRVRLGHVAASVVKHAPCSVLVVRALAETPTGVVDLVVPAPEATLKILLAYDGSAPSEAALSLLESLPLGEHSEVTVLTVLELMSMFGADVQQRLSELWDVEKREADLALSKAAERLRMATPNVQTLLHESEHETQSILDATSELEAHLLVIGYEGRTAIQRFLVGSNTIRAIHDAPCSVLVVRAR